MKNNFNESITLPRKKKKSVKKAVKKTRKKTTSKKVKKKKAVKRAVKKKRVKKGGSKKKVVKKKTSKKKHLTKRKKRKYTKRKKTRKKYARKHQRITDIEDFYKVVNRVQIKKETAYVQIVCADMIHVCKNVLKDSNLTFEEKKARKGLYFTIYPNFDEVIIDVDVEELEDEFLEDGQIF